MSARMLYRVLLSYLLYLSVYASPSKYSPRDVSKTQFPSLEKALVGVFDLASGAHVGKVSTGAELVDVGITGGKVETVKGFSGPHLISVVEHGQDWLYIDNDGKRLRLNARALLKADNGDFLSFTYTGIVSFTPEIQAVVGGTGSTTSFGDIVVSGGFETGSAKYKELENSIFVGTGRLVVHDDHTFSVQFGLSKVVA